MASNILQMFQPNHVDKLILSLIYRPACCLREMNEDVKL